MRFIPAQTMGRVVLYMQSAAGGYIFWPKSRIVIAFDNALSRMV